MPSFVSELLDEGNIGNEEAEAMIRDCAALAYGGSSHELNDTISAADNTTRFSSWLRYCKAHN